MVWRYVVLGGAVLAQSACATLPRSCRNLVPGLLPVALQEASVGQLQCAADQGMTAGQVMLAKRYETGDGVPRDVGRAVALYERAATPIPPTTAIYSPPARLGGQAQMILINNPNAGPGSSEAQYLLGKLLLDGRGTPRDEKRGLELIARAAAQNHQPAVDELRRTSERRSVR